MRRWLKVAGCALLALAGLAVAAVIEPWPLVWCVGFPMAYAGAVGVLSEMEIIKKDNGDNRKF